jgi:hypothetical protein
VQFRKYLDSVEGTFWLQVDGNETALADLAEKLSWLNYAIPEDEPVRLLDDLADEATVEGYLDDPDVDMLVGTLTVPGWTNAEQVEGELYGGKIVDLFDVSA